MPGGQEGVQWVDEACNCHLITCMRNKLQSKSKVAMQVQIAAALGFTSEERVQESLLEANRIQNSSRLEISWQIRGELDAQACAPAANSR